MIKRYTLSFGSILALSFAACTPPAVEPPKAEIPQVEQVKPERSQTQTRENRPRPAREGGRRTPPEVAYATCTNLEVEAACSFETPRGTRSGVCRTREGEDRAVCFGQRPQGQRGGQGGQRGGQRPHGERSGGQ